MKKEIIKTENEEILIKFLSLTREGKYALVDKLSLPYSRLKEETEETLVCEEMYYNLA